VIKIVFKEKSVGAILFRRSKGIEFLLLHYGAGHWDFPKGGVEEGETEQDTMRREVFEETGIKDISVLVGFREQINYFYKRAEGLVSKEVIFFLAETRSKIVKISFEHDDFKWLPYGEAYKILTFDNSKKLLKKSDEFLKKYSSLKDFVNEMM
jgi:8-oxo-dGTP pyrophosphatase MutT (NUDIX family)